MYSDFYVKDSPWLFRLVHSASSTLNLPRQGFIAKLSVLLLAIISLGFSIEVKSQNVTLRFRNAPIDKVMGAITKQTGYSYISIKEHLREALPVTIQVNDIPVRTALQQISKGQPFGFEVSERIITLVGHKGQAANQIQSTDKQEAASTQSISGVITDSTGVGIPGVSIRVKNTVMGTSTDQYGRYELSGLDETVTLVISLLGFTPQEISTNGRTAINLVMKQSVSLLDESIVIGYGKTSRRFNTGSISKISAKEIETQPVSNPILAMQGRVPGLEITQVNGLPGSNINVQIRGRNSISQGSTPFYIIDGVPFVSDNLARNIAVSASSPLNSINPSDIESIEVLKDADATAIYGSRGANGVILITTKKAQSGKTSVDASIQTGWGKISRSLDYLTTGEFLEMRHEAFRNDGVTPTLSNAYEMLAWDTTRYTNWAKEMIGNTARTTNGQLRLSGGNQNTMISLGAGYYRESTVIVGDHAAERYTIDMNGNHRSKDGKFNFNLNANYSSLQSDMMYQSTVPGLTLVPNLPPLVGDDGVLRFNDSGYNFSNPLASLRQSYISRMERLTSSATLNYMFIPGLNLKVSTGYNLNLYDEQIRIPISSQNPANNPVGGSNSSNTRVTSWIAEPQLEYDLALGRQKLSFLVGSTLQALSNTGTSILANGYTNDNFLGSVSSSVASTITTTNRYSQHKYGAVFARVNYNLDSKYILNLTARRDGSSRFGPGRQFANFGAVGASWIISSERWVGDALPFVSFAKVRASFGTTGNDQIGDYQYLDTWSPTTYPYDNQQTLTVTRLFNEEFGWERSRKLDLAIEMGLLKDRIFFTTNWYRNVSDNQLIYYNLPSQTGFRNVLRNFPGKVENTGWEFSLNTTILQGRKLTWSASLNLTIPKNELLAFPGLENSTYSNSLVIGQPLNVRKGFMFKGVDPETGIYGFDDLNGDGVLNTLDYDIIGTQRQIAYGGWQNQFSFRGVSLDFLFQFVKQDGRHAIYGSSVLVGGRSNMPDAVLDRWQKPGDQSAYQKFSQQAGGAVAAAQLQVINSSASITDASFVRLKNIALSFELPRALLNRLKIERMKIFAQGQNLLTLTKYLVLDPEGQNSTQLPPLRVISTGLQIGL